MKNSINEAVVTGRRFRKSINSDGEKNWIRFSGWLMSNQPFMSNVSKNIKREQREQEMY